MIDPQVLGLPCDSEVYVTTVKTQQRMHKRTTEVTWGQYIDDYYYTYKQAHHKKSH
jgi:hypothetical protein